MAEPLLSVEGLCKQYRVGGSGLVRQGTVVDAVKGVSFELARGETLALVGESGSGKTTTAQCVLALTPPTAGTVCFEGVDVSSLSGRALKALRRRVQTVYQDPYESLDPRMTIEQTVAEPLQIHHIGGSRKERQALVSEALERVELRPAERFLSRRPHELSGGQRQRVAIAAALILGPDLLVADEPVSMLDVSVRAGIIGSLNRLRHESNLSMLVITHDLSTVAHLADRIAVMHRGEVVEQGPVRSVIRDPQHEYTRALLAAVPRRHAQDPVEAEA
jgi:ABC-type glutathione transport system ATPase component